jgi:hypothetical protein
MESCDNCPVTESSFRNGQKRTKPRRVREGAAAKRRVDPPRRKIHPAMASPEPVDEIDLAGPDRQTPKEIEQIEPTQEPRIKASDLFTFTKRTLSAEARELIAKIDEGGIPLVVTENLERIARAHGIEVSREMTPNEIVEWLRKLA